MSIIWATVCMCLIAVLSCRIVFGAEPALPDDVWSGKHGGHPAITLNREMGVSVVLPTILLENAQSSAEITTLVKTFLETYGPGMCSDIMDLNQPHADMHVQFYMQEADIDVPLLHFYRVAEKGATVQFDYAPARHANCTEHEVPMSDNRPPPRERSKWRWNADRRGIG